MLTGDIYTFRRHGKDTFNEITCQSVSQIAILATELENTNKIYHYSRGFLDNETEIVAACLNITS
jgi:hypothetical protein